MNLDLRRHRPPPPHSPALLPRRSSSFLSLVQDAFVMSAGLLIFGSGQETWPFKTRSEVTPTPSSPSVLLVRSLRSFSIFALISIALSSWSNIPFAAAQTTNVNHTLDISDPRITYRPTLDKWERKSFNTLEYLRVSELQPISTNGDGTTPLVNATFRGSSLYYLVPMFPFQSAVRISIDGGLATRLSMFDNRTTTGGGAPTTNDSSDPSGSQTLVLAQNLDVDKPHSIGVSSDTDDGSVFMVVGQFIYTAPADTISNTTPDPTSLTKKPSPNLRLILPLSIILPLTLMLALLAAIMMFYKRRKDAHVAPSSFFSRTGKPTPPRRGTDESIATGKDVDADGEELGEYTVAAAAFQRKSPPQIYRDPGFAQDTHRMQSFDSAGAPGSDESVVPLTQANLNALVAEESGSTALSHSHSGGHVLGGGNVPLAPSPQPSKRHGRRQKHQTAKSVVSNANTAELIAREIPYAPYLHTLAAPTEQGHSSNSHSQPNRVSNNSQPVTSRTPSYANTISTSHNPGSLKGGFFGTHIPGRFDSPTPTRQRTTGSTSEMTMGSTPQPIVSTTRTRLASQTSQTSSNQGLYPTYFPAKDPTVRAVVNEPPASTLGALKPNRRRKSAHGEPPAPDPQSEWTDTLVPARMEERPQGAAAPRIVSGDAKGHGVSGSPGTDSTLSSRPSMKRKAVPTMQDLERRNQDSGSSEDDFISPRPIQRRPEPSRPPPTHTRMASASESESESRSNIRPLPSRPRPLPHVPAASISEASTQSHSNSHSQSHNTKQSPPPSSYHASAESEQRPSSRQIDRDRKKPSGGRSSGGSHPPSAAKKPAYDPAWYPDRAAGGEYDDMYASEEETRAVMEGRGGAGAPPKVPPKSALRRGY
ncbi:hypothetical protein DFP72DRAFT_1172622 [Ephemerocybe angulata]|uniref:Uncharacterized protein n=1 Tax=Ephemerocybe angulata TaxID=980116 RepID=A0A8H6M3M9_9AGAR|nr:hypothetical protein DFP72DRAFT_1172622 [Tulosesus angulatus]